MYLSLDPDEKTGLIRSADASHFHRPLRYQRLVLERQTPWFLSDNRNIFCRILSDYNGTPSGKYRIVQIELSSEPLAQIYSNRPM